ncbi:MAG: hypothetical protein DDT22_00429 [candidate division WS2 bacterium]|nr:hypothetical protein [Candidatus Lithacetigena glycinireducens]MBT9174768.1 hypothetical protein [Candidatus Lithacetigena glycinireducens]
MNTEIEFKIPLTLLGQFHIGTGFGIGRFIDKTTIKDRVGAIYIPGSTIKGKAKHFGRQIANSLGLKGCTEEKPCKSDPCIVCKTFGSPLHQGNFFFSDAILPREIIKSITEESGENPIIPFRLTLNTKTGTKIDRRFGTVEENYLFTIETGMKGVSLFAKIYGRGNDFIFPDKGELPLELVFLLNSLKLITHLGGEGSRGLGRVKVEFEKIFINGKEASSPDSLIKEVEYYDTYSSKS